MVQQDVALYMYTGNQLQRKRFAIRQKLQQNNRIQKDKQTNEQKDTQVLVCGKQDECSLRRR